MERQRPNETWFLGLSVRGWIGILYFIAGVTFQASLYTLIGSNWLFAIGGFSICLFNIWAASRLEKKVHGVFKIKVVYKDSGKTE